MALEIGQKIRAVYWDGAQQREVTGYVTEILTNGSFTVSAYPPGEGPFMNLPLYFGENQ